MYLLILLFSFSSCRALIFAVSVISVPILRLISGLEEEVKELKSSLALVRSEKKQLHEKLNDLEKVCLSSLSFDFQVYSSWKATFDISNLYDAHFPFATAV